MASTSGVIQSEMGPERIWGLPVVKDAGLTEGTGVVGDFENFSLLAERKGMTIKVGYQNDDFIKNQRSIVAEIRAAFVVLGQLLSAPSPAYRRCTWRSLKVELGFNMRVIRSAVPGAGTDEVQTITIAGTPTGGTFKLLCRVATTEPITWVNVNATLVTCIEHSALGGIVRRLVQAMSRQQLTLMTVPSMWHRSPLLSEVPGRLSRCGSMTATSTLDGRLQP